MGDISTDDRPEGVSLEAYADTAALARVPLFEGLADDELAWIVEHAELVTLEPGAVLFRSGERADWMYIALEGVVQMRREPLGANAPTFVFRAGDVTGLLPFSRMKSWVGVGRAVTRAVLLRMHRDQFTPMLRRVPALESRIVAHLIDRVRDATRREEQLEKFQALGRLSAGIAHELNNPTSAIQRGVADTRRRLDERASLTASLIGAGISAEAIHRLDAIRASVHAPDPKGLDALERSDRAEAMASWLAECGVVDPWRRAPTFVEAGFERAVLERALGDIPRSACAVALAWLELGIAAQTTFLSIEQSARRVARVVEAMRTYTHRDRAREMTDVDIQEGIESALALFAGRASEKGVRLERDYASALPRIRAYPGDLNQVWAQLLDNALDAAPPRTGRVTVRTRAEDGMVIGVVQDDGPGIPPSIGDRVFEPFYTTKDVGAGTGLGLDVARRIVVDLHGGELVFTSEPGDTRFIARLPLTTVSTIGA